MKKLPIQATRQPGDPCLRFGHSLQPVGAASWSCKLWPGLDMAIRLGPDYNGRGKCMKTNGNRLGVLWKAWRPRMGWLVRLLSRSRMTGNAIHGHPDAHVCMFDGKYQIIVV